MERDDLLNAALEGARGMSNPQQVLEYYKSNPNALERFQAPVFENKVVAFVTELANITETNVTSERLFQDPDEEVSDDKQSNQTPPNKKVAKSVGRKKTGKSASSDTKNSTKTKKTEKPKRKMFVEFKLNSDEDVRKATVMNVQPRANGKYKGWLNVDEEGKGKICINWSESVEYWREVERVEANDKEQDSEVEETNEPEDSSESEDSSEVEENVILLTEEQECSKEVIEAKEKEIENLKKHMVFDVVPNTGQKTVSSKWVVTEKYKNNERKIKDRLVARGFEENTYNTPEKAFKTGLDSAMYQ